LLVVLIPGLLMLATIGLQRLEAGLDRDTVSSTDVAEFLEQAKADDVNTLAQDGMTRALDSLHRRLHDRDYTLDATADAADPPRLPTRPYVHHRGNPEFRPTRHANRV
jgi:hypothetical protein